MFFKKAPLPEISIGITTFEHRFEQYFKPLLAKLRQADPQTEIIVAVNGEHRRPFSEEYRAGIMSFLATMPRVFPVFFPSFRGVAKLWNSIIIHAGEDHVLMLNDDIMIDDDFLADVRKNVNKYKDRTFTINNSWSHYLVSRKEIDELGYFDERLLGIGEEDGDISWRYFQLYGRNILNCKMKGVRNFAEDSVYSYKPVNIDCHSGTKYSQFNREFMFHTKYRADKSGHQGMFDSPHVLQDPGQRQYPNESFYRDNRHNL